MEENNVKDDDSLSDEEAIMKIAQAMKDNAPTQEDKNNVHTFLTNVVKEQGIDNSMKIGNLRDDKDMNELGNPQWNTRGSLVMARICDKLIGNEFFRDYFNCAAVETLGTSLSREGFLIKQATTTTKQVADATKRRKVNKGMFGSRKIEESGGDINSNQPQNG